MPYCAVVLCTSKSVKNSGKSFYRLPTIIKHQDSRTEELSKQRRDQWLANISRADIKESSYCNVRVCSDHFVSGKPAALYENTDVDWAPTKDMGHTKIAVNPQLAVDRSERLKKRKEAKKRLVEADILLSFHNTVCSGVEELENDLVELESHSPEPDEVTSGVSCQTDLEMSHLAKEASDMTVLRMEVYTLREMKAPTSGYSQGSFQGNDEKVKFYTGLPSYALLMVIFKFVAPRVASSHRNCLSQFEEFVSVLMRLRLNSQLQDIAYQFSISVSTASRIFDRWIGILDERLQHLIVWPEREVLRANMPRDFIDAFGNKVAVIVDCFEVFLDRPSSLASRSMTWSNYKHNNTVKFLIGVTPQGVISYISRGWGGRVSDKHLTEHCSLLDNLLPGDIVLADRGFDIADSVGFYCATLAIPAFTRGKSQLSAVEVEETRKIANVRIHVERIIGSVRQKYQILSGNLPIEFVTCKPGQIDSPVDKIVRVCCSLVNMCPSVVSMD